MKACLLASAAVVALSAIAPVQAQTTPQSFGGGIAPEYVIVTGTRVKDDPAAADTSITATKSSSTPHNFAQGKRRCLVPR